MSPKPRHVTGRPRSSDSSNSYDLTGPHDRLAGEDDAAASVEDIGGLFAPGDRQPGDCYRYLVLMHACDLTASPTVLKLRVDALASVFAEYSAVHARDVFDMLRAMPDSRTCEHPALIKRLRQLAAIAGIPAMPKTEASL